MGKVKKFRFNARTLDDNVVKDGLESVNVLNGREPYFLVGGVATQGYLPTRCRRPTSDMDFALVRPLSKPDFREMVEPVRMYLHDMGYDTTAKTNNRSRSFALYLSKPLDDCLDCLCMEFVRRSPVAFEKHKKRLEREYEHARQKIVEGRETTYRASSPEDIAVPKLVRTINSIRRNPQLLQFIPPRLLSLSDEEVERRIDSIGEIRTEAVSNPGDPLLAGRLRLVSDIYDIRMLSELTGFNQEYFLRAERDWHDLNGNPEIRDRLFNIALPMFIGKPNA